MPGIYDWGVGEAADRMTNLYSAMSQDRARKAEESLKNVIAQKTMFDLNSQMKEEAMLSKKVDIPLLLRSKGITDPEELDYFMKPLQARGVADNMGFVEARYIPDLAKQANENTQFQMGLHSLRDSKLSQKETDLEEQYTKLQEKLKTENPTGWQQDEKLNGLEQQYKTVRLGRQKAQKEMERLKMINAKPDMSITKDEILSGKLGPEVTQTYIKNANQLAEGKDPTTEFQSYRAGKKALGWSEDKIAEDYRKYQREIALLGRQGRDPAVAENRDMMRQMQQENNFRSAYAPIQAKVDKVTSLYDAGKITAAQHDAQIRRIKTASETLLEPYRKYGLWNGWSKEPSSEYQAWQAGEEAKKKPTKTTMPLMPTNTQTPAPVKSKSGKDMWQWPDGKWYYEPPQGQ